MPEKLEWDLKIEINLFCDNLPQNLTMFRVTEAKACYLRKSTPDARKRSDLQQLLEVVSTSYMKLYLHNSSKFLLYNSEQKYGMKCI